MTEQLNVYEFSFKPIIAARSEDEAIERFTRDLQDYLHEEILDSGNWEIKLLKRNEKNEWMYRSFEIESQFKGE